MSYIHSVKYYRIHNCRNKSSGTPAAMAIILTLLITLSIAQMIAAPTAHAGDVDCTLIVLGCDTQGNDDIVDNTVDSADILDDSLTADDLAADSVTASELADNAVDTNAIINGAVTSDKLASDAVTTVKITDGAVTSDKLADGTVTTQKIATSAVDTDQLADNSVTAAKLAPGAIDSNAIADNSITTNHLQDNSVTFSKLGTDVQNRITNLEDSVDGLKGGLAMAMATANAPLLLQGDKTFSLSLGLGFYDDKTAGALKGGLKLSDNAILSGSVAFGDDNIGGGVGIGIGF